MSTSDPDIVARPLDKWPRPDTAQRRSPFKANWEKTLRKIRRELRLLDAGMVVVQIAFPEREISITTGWPRPDRSPSHPGVIVAADTKHGSLKWLCDACPRWTENVHAIALTLERLRLADLYGVTNRGEQYAGWKMLPGPITAGAAPGSGFASRGWTIEQAARWAADQFLARNSSRTHASANEIVARGQAWHEVYRTLAKALHPDVGGSPQLWSDLQEAARLLDSLHNRKGA